jgi:hypothetical protein
MIDEAKKTADQIQGLLKEFLVEVYNAKPQNLFLGNDKKISPFSTALALPCGSFSIVLTICNTPEDFKNYTDIVNKAYDELEGV